MLCPVCSADRKSHRRNEPCLSCRRESSPDRIVVNCWHCTYSDVVLLQVRETYSRPTHEHPRPPAVVREMPKPPDTPSPLFPAHISYIQSRGISTETAIKAGLYSSIQWVGEAHGPTDVIAFPYFDEDGKTKAVKYRTIEKEFSAVRGGMQILYGLEQTFDIAKPLVFVEGEFDRLACMEAGILNVVSVPAGAKAGDRFGWMQHSEKFVRQFQAYILFVDSDPPGLLLLEELARRLGRARCSSVTAGGLKDANGVLKGLGPSKLLKTVADAIPLPIAGVSRADDYRDKVKEVYRSGLTRGISTGLNTVDELYTIVPGQVTVITGVPGHGKSQFLDQLAVNIARAEGWRIAICSFEKDPWLHIAGLAGQHARRPVREGFEGRLSEEEFLKEMPWVEEHFVFIDFAGSGAEDVPTIDSILDKAQSAILRFGCRGIIIDPYNYIVSPADNETQFVSGMLTRVRMFARTHGVHIWFVAHPTKNYDRNKMPGGSDISGSAAWFSKADMGLTVFRHDESTSVTIWLWKVRHAHLGRCGRVQLQFDVSTGCYKDLYTVPATGERFGGQARRW